MLFGLIFVLTCLFIVTFIIMSLPSDAEKYTRMANHESARKIKGPMALRYQTLYWLMVNQIYGTGDKSRLHETSRTDRHQQYRDIFQRKEESQRFADELARMKDDDHLKKLAKIFNQEQKKKELQDKVERYLREREMAK